jgi:hypothetical protein
MGMIEELKSSKWGIELDSDFLMGIIEELKSSKWGIELDRCFFDGNN